MPSGATVGQSGRADPTAAAGPAHGEPESSAAVEVTVVVPYYNPGAALQTTVEQLLAVLSASASGYEVIAVDDGSTDGSGEALDHITDRTHLQQVRFAANRGKGAALREGLARGQGRWLGFIDADGDIDPAVFARFLATVRAQEADVVLGSKRHPDSSVTYPLLRRVYSWGYQQFCRVLFRLNIRDTQTGVKLFRRDVVEGVLPRMLEKRFAWDLEFFVIARHLGYTRLVELPVRLQQRFTSTVSPQAVARTLLDTAAIWYRLNLRRYYDR